MSAKRIIILATGILCATTPQPVQAATHAILLGASIQAKIDIAVASDIVAIFGGTYNEDITVNKAIRLVKVSGQQVIGQIDGDKIYPVSTGYKVAARSEGCGGMSFAAAAAACCL